MEWLDGSIIKAAAWGASGGVIRWVILRENWKSGLASIFVGLILAAALDGTNLPFLSEILGILPEGARPRVSGLLIGLGGIGIAGFLIDFFANIKKLQKKEDTQ